MPNLSRSVPEYRKHRASGQAVVTIAGRDRYLGPHGSKASKIEYDRLIGEWLTAGRPAKAALADAEITVTELVAGFWRHAKRYYVKHGEPTGGADNFKPVLKLLREVYGRTAAAAFGPLALKAVRDRLIKADHSRRYVNDNISRLKQIFKWAASEQLLDESVYRALSMVAGLREGRTEAREAPRVKPVDAETVEKTLPHLPAVVGDMVRFQRLTGGRPQDVCNLRPCDIDTTAEVWLYRPERHKTEHHGRERVICIGPKAKDILRPYLLRADDSHCFSPADSERKRRQQAHEARKTPLSCGNKPGTNKKRKPKRTAGDGYTTNSYRRAIHRGCVKAGVEKWSPNRLRHTAATEIRRRYGIEGAQVVLGHAAADVTQVYAERDLAKAAEIMREVG